MRIPKLLKPFFFLEMENLMFKNGKLTTESLGVKITKNASGKTQLLP